MDGIFNINKPRGKTSFNVVAAVKRLTGERRVGHAGTLDPMAIGVLPVCVGRGTRIVEFLMDATKAYQAEIELGVTTDTYDSGGKVLDKKDPSGISQKELESALASFRGSIQQTPPMYSAVKYQGRPLYQLARAGITIERKSRPVFIYSLELVDWQTPVARVEIVCGKGTYIRSLADDLGRVLGCGAYLKGLVRLRYGIFKIGDAVELSQLEQACHYGYCQQLIYPVDSVLSHWSAIVVDEDEVLDIRNGRPLEMHNSDTPEINNCQNQHILDSVARCRAYALDGRFIGVLRFDSEKGHWQPEKVFID